MVVEGWGGWCMNGELGREYSEESGCFLIMVFWCRLKSVIWEDWEIEDGS